MYESFIFFSQIPMRQTVQSTKNGKLNIYMKFVKHGTICIYNRQFDWSK